MRTPSHVARRPLLSPPVPPPRRSLATAWLTGAIQPAQPFRGPRSRYRTWTGTSCSWSTRVAAATRPRISSWALRGDGPHHRPRRDRRRSCWRPAPPGHRLRAARAGGRAGPPGRSGSPRARRATSSSCPTTTCILASRGARSLRSSAVLPREDLLPEQAGSRGGLDAFIDVMVNGGSDRSAMVPAGTLNFEDRRTCSPT